MIGPREKYKLLDASDDIRPLIEHLSQQHLVVEHEERADQASRPGLAKRAEVDVDRIFKFLANVLFEDAQLEP